MRYELKWIRSSADFEAITETSTCIVRLKNTDDLQQEFYLYSFKFNLVANQLIDDTMSSRNNGKNDSWFFPIVFLYRHSLELLLKSIAFKYIIDKNDKITFVKTTGHNLKRIFDVITSQAMENSLDTSREEIRWLDDYLSDISDVDSQSDMFRYPFSNKMAAFFTKQTHVNLRALKKNMNTAYSILYDILNNSIKSVYQGYAPILLLSGGDYYEQSVIGWKSSSCDFYPYIKGYMEAANYLGKSISENDSLKDELFLPMCYLYRNGIELSLKRILFEDCKLSYDKAFGIIRRKKYSILKVWNSIKNEIDRNSNAPKDDTTMEDVEIYVNQLHKIDMSSDKFRYPVDKNLVIHFKKEAKYDIKNIRLCFDELFTFLDCVDGMLANIRDIEAEIEQEMRSYAEDYNDY